jgi:hypothetical protein
VKLSGLSVNSATRNHHASKDVCSHLISALKEETTKKTSKHTQTMAAAKAAIRTCKENLHEQELMRITDPMPAATKRTFPSEAKKQASGCKHHQVTSMELVSLIWNSEMHCIFDIAEHHPISPLTTMVVELNSP